jgi:excisionase family DNA binding protein
MAYEFVEVIDSPRKLEVRAWRQAAAAASRCDGPTVSARAFDDVAVVRSEPTARKQHDGDQPMSLQPGSAKPPSERRRQSRNQTGALEAWQDGCEELGWMASARPARWVAGLASGMGSGLFLRDRRNQIPSTTHVGHDRCCDCLRLPGIVDVLRGGELGMGSTKPWSGVERDQTTWRPREVAATLGVHPGTVLRWIRSGRLAHYRTPTGRVLITAEAADKLFRTHGVDRPLDELE